MVEVTVVPWHSIGLVIWLALELLFWLGCHVLKRRLNALRVPPKYEMDRKELMRRVLHAVEVTADIRKASKFFERWFLDTDFSLITTGNVRSFFSWAFFAKRESNLDAEEQAEMRVLLDLTVEWSKRMGEELRVGPPTPNLRHVDFTLEPLESVHRPLLWYSLVFLKARIAGLLLTFMGWRRYSHAGMVYWYRHASDAGVPCLELRNGALQPRLPLVCFHGISSGIFLYLPFLIRICAGRTAFIVEQPHISMSLDLSPPTREQVLDTLHGICRRHRVEKAAFMGHSFGSIPLTWMVYSKSPLLAQLILVDAVSPLLAMPDVAYNFIYRKPSSTVEWIIYLAASSELGVAYTLRRNFWWYQNCLWLEDVPKDIPVLMGVSGADEVCPAALQTRYADSFKQTRGGLIKTVVWPQHGHGRLLVDFKAQNELFRAAFEQEVKYVTAARSGPKMAS